MHNKNQNAGSKIQDHDHDAFQANTQNTNYLLFCKMLEIKQVLVGTDVWCPCEGLCVFVCFIVTSTRK